MPQQNTYGPNNIFERFLNWYLWFFLCETFKHHVNRLSELRTEPFLMCDNDTLLYIYIL